MPGIPPVYDTGATPNSTASPTASKTPTCSEYTVSTLASLGKTVGIGLFRCITYVVIQGFIFVHTRVFKGSVATPAYQAPRFPEQDYKLSNSFQFDECLDRDPLQAAEKLLHLLETDTSAFKAIITSNFKRVGNPNRESVIGFIDEVFRKALSSPELIKHMDRVVMADYGNKELAVLNDRTLDLESVGPEVGSANQLQREYERVERKALDIWSLCQWVISMLYGEDDLAVLKLRYTSEFLGRGKPVITLGHFIERLNYKIGWRALTSREQRFNPTIEALLQLLTFLQYQNEVREIPRLHRVLARAQAVVSTEEAQTALFDLVCDLDHEMGSPKKRRPSGLRDLR